MGLKETFKKWNRPIGAEKRDEAAEAARASGASESEAKKAGKDAQKDERKKKMPGATSGAW